jgi:hypothetical protein
MSIQDTAPPSPFANPDVRTADLDFDKRIDIIQSLSTGNGADHRIWFNAGDQSYAAAITVPQASSGQAFERITHSQRSQDWSFGRIVWRFRTVI